VAAPAPMYLAEFINILFNLQSMFCDKNLKTIILITYVG